MRDRERSFKVISSRGSRHQQLIYLPHVINYILFMLSSPHHISPHVSLHVPLFLLVSLYSRRYDTSAPPIQSMQRKGDKWTKRRRRRDGRTPEMAPRQEVVVYDELRGIRDGE